jgi:hypothetical protein
LLSIFWIFHETVGVQVVENIIANPVVYGQATTADRPYGAAAAGRRALPVPAGRFIVVDVV